MGFLIGGRDTQGAGGAFSLKRTDDFDVSDCAATPDGNLLVLERRFSWTRGLAVRIRSVPLAAIKSGALVDGRELMFADMGSQIDNMEGLSVHRDSSGALVLTLISDDNFSVLQRTLLLQFTLVREYGTRVPGERSEARDTAQSLQAKKIRAAVWPLVSPGSWMVARALRSLVRNK